MERLLISELFKSLKNLALKIPIELISSMVAIMIIGLVASYFLFIKPRQKLMHKKFEAQDEATREQTKEFKEYLREHAKTNKENVAILKEFVGASIKNQKDIFNAYIRQQDRNNERTKEDRIVDREDHKKLFDTSSAIKDGMHEIHIKVAKLEAS